VSRWGRTSFDVTVEGTVGDRRVFTAVLVYVNVVPGTKTPVRVPDEVRAVLSA
jgi:acyl-CoA thioesterase FadM